MNVGGIITQALNRIPEGIRFWMLVAFAAVVAGLAVLRIFEVDLPYDKLNQVFLLVGGYLGVQSAANVPTVQKQAAARRRVRK